MPDLRNLIIDKVLDIKCFYTKCPKCGYKNTKEHLCQVCPVCNENLYVLDLLREKRSG